MIERSTFSGSDVFSPRGAEALRQARELASLGETRDARGPGRAEGPGFSELLTGAIQDARTAEDAETRTSEAFAAGDPNVGLHEVVIAADRASIAMRFAVTLKNRAIEAYRELMNTPL